MRKTIIQLDFANTNRAATEAGITLDYKDLLTYLSFDYDVRGNVVHLGVHPKGAIDADNLIEYLTTSGWMVKTKTGTVTGRTFKANIYCEVSIDCTHQRFVNGIDMLILCTGDPDFVPLVEYLKNYAGVYICIAAFSYACSKELINKADSFIDLGAYFDDFKKRSLGGNGVGASEDNYVDAEYVIQ